MIIFIITTLVLTTALIVYPALVVAGKSDTKGDKKHGKNHICKRP